MRRFVTKAVPVILLILFVVPVLHAETWSGWITDSGCGAKGANAEHKECALRCAKRGAALALYNSADQKVYKLDDQEAAKAQLGHKVKIVGTLEGDTIKVTTIAADTSE